MHTVPALQHPFRLAQWLAIALASLTLLTPRALADNQTYDRYFVVTINDQRVGYARERAMITAEDRLVSSSEMVFRIARFESELRISVRTEFVETLNGQPISMQSITDMGGSLSNESYVWNDQTVIQTTINGGRTTTREHPAPTGTWLTPSGAASFINSRMQAGADQITYSTIDPSTGLDRVLHTMKREGHQQIDLLGVATNAIRWSITQSVMPDITTTTYTNAHGETIRSEMPFGAMRMVMLRADRDTALADQPPAEIMASTLVQVDRRIPSPRTLRRASYLLIPTAPDIQLPDLPTTASQRAERLDDGSIRVRIDLDQPIHAPTQDALNPAYLASSTVVDTGDDAIAAIVKRALAGTDPNAPVRERAEAMRRFVHRFIRDKSLDVGFATASEVVRNPVGDCTEHAVLLAAMLRINGIPSRAANGLIYVDQFGSGERVFGFHMWTQALITRDDGIQIWEDFDAAWPLAMDATHIITSTTDLSDDTMINSYAAVARIIGAITIRVEEPSP